MLACVYNYQGEDVDTKGVLGEEEEVGGSRGGGLEGVRGWG